MIVQLKTSQIRGGLYGVVVGDAIGIPYEFRGPKKIPELTEIEMTPPTNYERAHADMSPGTWSDDSAQTLCLFESLIEKKTLDLTDFGNKLVKWMDEGYWSVGGKRLQIGLQTRSGLLNFKNGKPPEESGDSNARGMPSNGSLMRIIGLPLYHRGSDEELVKFAHLQSKITHGMPIIQICCALYCLIARELLNNPTVKFDKSYSIALNKLTKIYKANNDEFYNILKTKYIDHKISTLGGLHVVDCLKSIVLLLDKYNTYEDVIKHAIKFGYDTDTTAAIAGGLAGILYGVESIPKRWLDSLADKERLEELLTKYFNSTTTA